MKQIIGRTKEKARLDHILASQEPEFIALYGRRRVGKTWLIRQYLAKHIVFDLSGTKEGSKQSQLNNFFAEYILRTKGELDTTAPTTWQEAFAQLARYLHHLPKSATKQVVFLDEMPWLDTPKSGFVSALEFLWNQHISRMDHVVLIACGSASSWIRKNLINARGGLYGRVTQRMKLMPFNLRETELFLLDRGVNLPRYQILELYMALGGIPYYLKEVEKGKSVSQLIDGICFAPQGRLREEYSHLYHSLFRNADNHIHIIEALAEHPQGMSREALLRETKLPEASFARALEELIECDFVTDILPLFSKKKETIFKLIDLYSLFYLKFIQKNRKNAAKTWEQMCKTPSYIAWSGYAYENIALMHIDQIKSALGISGVFTQHSSWKTKATETLPGVQIDLLIDRADKVVHLCEAKFTQDNYAMPQETAEQLRVRKMVFRQISKTKKAVFTTLLTTFPAQRNKYYLQEVEAEVTMDAFFMP